MTQSIGVLGNGVLGSAICRGFLEHAEVRVHDIVNERRTHTLAEAATADIVFIALPTPAMPDGRCDTIAVEAMLKACEDAGYWRPESCFVIRSTVPVGFTQAEAAKRDFRLPLMHSPEFLTARCALTDFQTPARNIIGIPRYPSAWKNWPEDKTYDENQLRSNLVGSQSLQRLRDLYRLRFPGVPCMEMPSDASELVKLGCNAFFGTKVTYFNLLYDVAESRGLDWGDVIGGILSDGRIAHAHASVNSGGHGRGYSGTCIPKDTADLFHCAREAGVDAELLRAVHDRNVRTRGDDPGLAKIELPQ